MNSVMALLSQPTQSKSTLTQVTSKSGSGFQDLLSSLRMGNQQGESELAIPKEKVEQLLGKMQNLLKKLGIDLKDLGIEWKNLFSNMEEGMSLDKLFHQIATKITSDNRLEQTKGIIALQGIVEKMNGLNTEKLELQKEVVEEADLIMAQLAQVVQPIQGQGKRPQASLEPILDATKTASPQNIKANRQQAELQLHTLWQKFQQLTNKVLTGNSSAKQTPQLDGKTAIAIKQVLQEMSKILKTVPQQGKELLNQTIIQGSETQQKLFKDLFQSFQNRQNLPQSYHQQSPVKGNDIVKWAAQFLEKQTMDSQQKSASSTSSSVGQQLNMPMSKVEQFIIHVNQNQTQSAKQQQFIQEFERVLQSSKMFTNRAGGMEMQLKLKPGNMGDMTVRMVQMNGELAVKILVSTQAAKDMLDGNLNQLRHMFSPQQVVIEKQDNLQSQQAFFQDTNLSEEDRGDQRGEQASEEQDAHDDGEEEGISFQEVLMNEKV